VCFDEANDFVYSENGKNLNELHKARGSEAISKGVGNFWVFNSARVGEFVGEKVWKIHIGQGSFWDKKNSSKSVSNFTEYF
jgi:hypothetical protein